MNGTVERLYAFEADLSQRSKLPAPSRCRSSETKA